jgi:hypothetical protein
MLGEACISATLHEAIGTARAGREERPARESACGEVPRREGLFAALSSSFNYPVEGAERVSGAPKVPDVRFRLSLHPMIMFCWKHSQVAVTVRQNLRIPLPFAPQWATTVE